MIDRKIATAIYTLRAEGYDTGSQIIVRGEFATQNPYAIQASRVLAGAGLLTPDPASGLPHTYKIPEDLFEKFTEYLRVNPDFIESEHLF